jgi:Domain of unknown function (DUF4365)
MDLAQQKEEFSKAYVKAVAAVCGYATQEPSVDDDSVDLGLAARGGSGTVKSPRLDLQLKCTARNLVREDRVDFPLPIKNYDELRSANFMVPRILVVVVVPEDVVRWIKHSEEELLLRHCGYWHSLRGFGATQNQFTVTVNIARTQVFDVTAVTDIMDRIGNGGLP